MTICPTCGVASVALDQAQYDAFIDLCDNPPPPTDALRKALSRYPYEDGITLQLTRQDILMLRSAIFAQAWECPPEGAEESRWLALERRIWTQYQRH